MADDDIAKPGKINYEAFDRFTVAHFGVGVALGLARAPWWLIIVGALGWELLERPLKRKVPKMFPHSTQDTASNAIVDASAVIAGAALVKAVVRR